MKTLDTNPEFDRISGLEWQTNWRVDNGADSFVVPFPSNNPFNIVYHGHVKFDYGHYGIHLGQADRLTFLGPSSRKITAQFIDCREGSPTLHNRMTSTFYPSSSRALYIPPGVAHAFDGLEDIYTLNTYVLYLPDPSRWVSGETDWTIENDVINLPLDVTSSDLPVLHANDHRASDLFYKIIADNQRKAIPHISSEYPFTEEVEIDGKPVRIAFHKRRHDHEGMPEWKPVPEIEGVGWARHFVLWSGDQSGFVPSLDTCPFYVVDHGEVGYEHDAYGIHLCQRDRLTFLGRPTQDVQLSLVDCRAGSPTLHRRVEISFTPSPLRFLVIPNGVAHAFRNLDNVFTLNRPFIFTDDEDNYEPGNDVIDWPRERGHFPKFDVSKTPVSPAFYQRQTIAQREMMRQPPEYATPVVVDVVDDEGRTARIAIRRHSSPRAK